MKGRTSTLMNELSKDLGGKKFQYDPTDKETRSAILKLSGICEYCESNSATTFDHYMPLIIEGLPSHYCNDMWNMIPCCASCNSSKGSRGIWEWFSSRSAKNPLLGFDETRKQEILNKFMTYDIEYRSRHYEKEYNREKVQGLVKKIKDFMDEIEKDVSDIEVSFKKPFGI